jgi:hypothetical protein
MFTEQQLERVVLAAEGIAYGLVEISRSLDRLGTENAAVEHIGECVKEAGINASSPLETNNIRDGLFAIAEAIVRK